MSCLACQVKIINTVVYQELSNQYIKLYRQMFPKKPIVTGYCAKCLESIISDMEIEQQSRIEHHKCYSQSISSLKNQDSMLYSLNKETKSERYTFLSTQCEEYKRISDHFHETLNYEILRIEKNNNSVLEKKFQERSQQLTCQKIMYLFHGSSNTAYDNILDTGFDLSYANVDGFLGGGIYFAKDASYSHGYGRTTQTNLGSVHHLLYCKVNVGQTCKGRSGLNETPKGFDGVHSDHATWAFFNNYQGIPEYIIYYLVSTK